MKTLNMNMQSNVQKEALYDPRPDYATGKTTPQ